MGAPRAAGPAQLIVEKEKEGGIRLWIATDSDLSDAARGKRGHAVCGAATGFDLPPGASNV
jgi:hypothetical protein